MTSTTRGAASTPASTDELPPALAFALRMATRMRDAEDEASALALVEDYIREEGEAPAAVAARDELLAYCAQVLDREAARIRDLRASGQKDEADRLFLRLRTRMPERLQGSLEAKVNGGAQEQPLAAKPATPEDAAPPRPAAEVKPNPYRSTFDLLKRNLAGNESADAHYQLGKWATEHDLHAEARECYEQAIALDAFHADARKALGHVLHEGRWYAEDEYKEKVLGLVKGPDGKWVKPGDLADGTREREKGGGDAPRPVAPRPRGAFIPPPPPAPYKEDTGWYQDNEAVCGFDQAPWYESKYYRIKTNIKPEYAKRYGEMMDRYFKRFLKVFEDFMPGGRYKKSELKIFASHAEFMASTQMPPTVGGYYSPMTKEVVAYHGMFGAQGTTRDVLAHEGTHQFQDLVLQGKFRNAPIWIIEGLAVFFESAYWDEEKQDIRVGLIPRERLWSLKRGEASNSLIPLRDLIRTPQPSFTGYHYAHAWSLIYMVLYYSDNAKVRKRNLKWFSDLFSAALERPVTADFVEEKIGGRDSFKALEEEWKSWIKELPYEFDPKRD